MRARRFAPLIGVLILVVAAGAVVKLRSEQRASPPPSPSPSASAGVRPNGPLYLTDGPDGPGGGETFLYRVNPDGSDLRSVFFSRDIRHYRGPLLSPDGRYLALAMGGSRTRSTIAVMTADGSELYRVPGGLIPGSTFGADTVHDSSPSWSPDGSSIVFSSNRCCLHPTACCRYNLFVVKRDGTGLRRLTTDTAGHSTPAWSPDGSTILYTRRGNNTGHEIWRIGTDGKNPKALIADGRFNGPPVWSPDALRFAYTSDRGNSEDSRITTMRPDGTSARTIFRCRGSCFFIRQIAWSPDGTEIAFTFAERVPRGWRMRLATIGADGSGFRTVPTGRLQPDGVSWRPA